MNKKMLIKKQFILPLFILFISNAFLYWLPMALCVKERCSDLSIALDDIIPLLPGFIFIYISYFAFWIVNYIVIANHSGEEAFYRFFTADLTSKIVCALIFVVFPTTMLRPVVSSDALPVAVLNYIYALDEPVNLFPSMHCLTSWLCFIGVKNTEGISKPYKVFCGVYAVLILLSTVFVKQHLALDVLAGVALAQAGMWFARGSNFYVLFMRLFTKRSKADA